MSEIGTNSEEDSLVISCVRCLEMGWFAYTHACPRVIPAKFDHGSPTLPKLRRPSPITGAERRAYLLVDVAP